MLELQMEPAFSDYCLNLKRIVMMRGRGISSYAIAKKLSAEGNQHAQRKAVHYNRNSEHSPQSLFRIDNDKSAQNSEQFVKNRQSPAEVRNLC
jgi:hypothetical protein